MELYTTPRSAHYTARTRNYDGSFNVFYTSCTVIGESAQCYFIRPTVPINGHKANDTMKVRKHNVRFKDAVKSEPAEHDYSGAWWNN